MGLVTTGSEVYYGRIQDQFTPVIKAKLAEYGAEVTHHVLLPDDHAAVTEKIKEFLADGVDMVLCTGGMSVDPDDKTPLAIKNAGVNVVTYGAPGAAWGHVPAQLYGRWPPGLRPARLCDVRQADDF